MVSICHPSIEIQISAYFILVLFELSTQNCRFPKYVQTSSAWTATYNDGVEFKAYFRSDVISASKCRTGQSQCQEYERRCIQKEANDTYEVEHIDKRTKEPAKFLCMQFIRRSDNIIQIRESQALSYHSPKSCDDNSLILDNWPIASTENFHKPSIPCPFVGGYNMRLITSQGQSKCPEQYAPPRIESECESGDGIHINFRSSACMDSALEMKVYQSLHCVATWVHGNYTFVILRPQDGDFHVWCLRLKGRSPLNKIEEGHIFIDFVCDPGDGHGQIRDTSNYLTLEFEQHIVNSICADELSYCSEKRFCETAVRRHCPKACRQCSGELNPCTFPEYLRGIWYEDYGENKNTVRINFYGLEIGDAAKFQCYETDGHDFQNRTMLLQTFDNGCFPRYACLDIQKVANSAVEYRLGQRVSWPVQEWGNLKSVICNNSKFQPSSDEKARFGKTLSEKPMKFLIDSRYHFSVNCTLTEWMGFRGETLYTREDNQCDTCFIYCANNRHFYDRIVKVALNCTSKIDSQRQDYKCIASMKFDGITRAIITRSLHKHEEFMCWIFRAEGVTQGEAGRIYVLNAADCNKEAVNSIIRGDFIPRNYYIIPSNPPRSCPYIPFATPCEHEDETKSEKVEQPGRKSTPKYVPPVESITPRYWLPTPKETFDQKNGSPVHVHIYLCISLQMMFILKHFLR
ncbi:hypothetical protein ACJMK2_012343 [Sinanodonta woodiana]|uniref:DUF7043 domain-containing protein n=1 Tax=Sinanodonta woodiana TaxID=1069815 RepID=A0ABD3V9G7_SINWO